MFIKNIIAIYIKITNKKILFPYKENTVGCIFLINFKSIYPDCPKFTFCSIEPIGFIIPAIPLFDERTIYFPLSMALKILCTKCCLGPRDLPNQPSSERLIIKSKSGLLNNLPE